MQRGARSDCPHFPTRLMMKWNETGMMPRGGLRQLNKLNDLRKSGTLNLPTTACLIYPRQWSKGMLSFSGWPETIFPQPLAALAEPKIAPTGVPALVESAVGRVYRIGVMLCR